MGAGLQRAVKAAKATRAKRDGGLKMRDWAGQALPGTWYASYKIDGVCVIVTASGAAVSRAGKPLYNVPARRLPPGIYECFLGSWEKSVSALRTQWCEDIRAPMIDLAAFYMLAYPNGQRRTDARLNAGMLCNPTPETVSERLQAANAAGYEGLVLCSVASAQWWKVKPRVTYDVPVTGVVMGKGKHAGRMGALITPKGNVGTGFSDKDRDYFAMFHNPGQASPPPLCKENGTPLLVEVEAMGLTPSGKFRHARFLRIRWDK